eukprot:TRINITY_DN18495_c0_g1_i1.p1 TRINITY_DN18495_c0_g1~~TRINITY_DN18495_c0_g1_i1.p1  ORF type:complete len:643 (+),score=167.74 TRINITY_DN18495_c0_g1_i1:84-2012(+)
MAHAAEQPASSSGRSRRKSKDGTDSIASSGIDEQAAASAPPNVGDDGLVENAPHSLNRQAVPYTIVIPTLGRWRPACEVNPHESALKGIKKPFILAKTLGFLERHCIAKDRVQLFVADADERKLYEEALASSAWSGMSIVVGVRGIRAQRNYITKQFKQEDFIVSIDDDVTDIRWKHRPGISQDTVTCLPPGSLERLIFDAHHRMTTYGAFIAGLNVSDNPMNMNIDGISTRCGEVNGFFYFFINRHDEALLPVVQDATEDAERSLRYFRKDKKVLRYRMYAGLTRCFQNHGGLQSLFGEWGEQTKVVNGRRKEKEREAAVELHKMFPELTSKPKEKKTAYALEVHFKPKGGLPIPSTTLENFKRNSKMEADAAKSKPPGRRGRPSKAKKMKEAEEQAAHDAEPEPCRDAEPAPPHEPEPAAVLEDSASGDEDVTLPVDKAHQGQAGADDAVDESISESTSSDSDFDPGEEAKDEDSQLLEGVRLARVQAQEQGREANDEELVRRAVMRSCNGDFEDPMAEALKLSSALAEEEERKKREEDLALKSALSRSLSDNDGTLTSVGAASRPAAIKRSSSVLSISDSESVGKRGRPEVDGSMIPDQFMATLADMGFELSPESLENIYRDSDGDVEVAALMLASVDS